MVSAKALTVLLSILLVLFFGYIYFSNYGRVNLSDPVIQNALKECGIDNADEKSMGCYLQAALGNYRPEVCLLANPSVDDLCIQYYYERRDSAAACDEIKKVKPGSLPGCEEYYRQECSNDSDCFAATCCHPTSCTSARDFPVPECNEACTKECSGPMDCGRAYCGCEKGKCGVIPAI